MSSDENIIQMGSQGRHSDNDDNDDDDDDFNDDNDDDNDDVDDILHRLKMRRLMTKDKWNKVLLTRENISS